MRGPVRALALVLLCAACIERPFAEPAVQARSQVVQVHTLRRGQADPAQRLGVHAEELRRRRQPAPVQGLEPGQDRSGRSQ